MKFDPTDALNRMSDLGDKTQGTENGPDAEDLKYQQMEADRQNIMRSFFLDETFNTNQEIEGTSEDSSWEQGAECSESWNRFMEDILSKLEKKTPELLNKIKEASKNRILVDLGCGTQPEVPVEIANGFGCAGYLGVDKFNVGRSYSKKEDGGQKRYYEKTSDITLRSDINSAIPAVLMREDMLEALKMLKDNSSVLLFNGIEWELFRLMPEEKRRQYFSDIAKELHRVVGEKGYILSTETQMLTYGGLNLVKDEEFAKVVNPHKINAIAELYRIVS